ncbi:MAG: protein kinase [Gemmatimonadales bacterium]|nr:protein kinase [Gemmatimonadales bacterium]
MNPLDRLTAALADRYRIEREIGAGGMATVYLAHDIRHHRAVAIKVLRPELAAVIGAERFLSEIRTTANLQHPHILPLFDSGEADSFLFYVMPFIAGESLRDRIAREHQLPVVDAVRIATEIAGALDYAHRQGVIHRDIKPENVMLHDGQALVADFGIALAITKTTGSRMTETGMSLGTPHYMSPEQAMGEREITGRSDVYALGAITYEMLAGEPPFTGPTAQAIIARVMTEEPRALTTQRKAIPPGVEEAVFTALEKLPADRYATAAEFAAALKNLNATSMRTAARPAVSGRRGWMIAAGMGAVMLGAGFAMGRAVDRGSGGLTGVIRMTIDLGDSLGVRPIGNLRLAVSPTGERIAFVGSDGPDAALWVRALDDATARLLPDTKGAFAPFFSPDGESVGFFTSAGGQVALRVISAAGGAARTIVQDSVAIFGGGDWGDDGNIYFTTATRGLARVSATGGPVVRISKPDSTTDIKEHDYPDVIPGSRFALVMLWKGSIGANSVGAVDLQSGAVTELSDGSMIRYVAPEFVVIGAADGRLMAARFDADKGTLLSTPVLIEQNVQDETSNGTVQFGVSEGGTLVYQAAVGGEVRVVWVDRAGSATPVDTTLAGSFSSLALSPDGLQIALSRGLSGENHIWVKQLATGAFSRLSFDVTTADRPVWTPSGNAVAFLATRNGRRTAWMRRADGSDSARAVVPGGMAFDEIAFDRSGRYTVFRSEGGAQGSRRLFVFENGVDTLPRPLLSSRYDNFAMTLSPDGKWLAHVSDESGSREVYVRPFPNVDSARFAISVAGGVEPVWSRDGRELFYRTGRGEMFSVAIATGSTFTHTAPRLLFAKPEFAMLDYYRAYDVHPDGKRFLMFNSGAAESKSLKVVFNWRTQLERATRTTK